MNEQIERIAYEVADAFCWVSTPQGHEYWKDVHAKLCRLAHIAPSSPTDQLTIPGWDLT